MSPNQLVFLDTNVLVYFYDQRDPTKHQIAVKLINDVLSDETAVISSQVIAEFCNVMSSKKGIIMKLPDLKLVVVNVFPPLLKHVPSIKFYERAVELRAGHALSFYDALIVQAALDLDCAVLYSEDLQDGQKFGKLDVVNPFNE